MAAAILALAFLAPTAAAAVTPPPPGTAVTYGDLVLGPGEQLTFTRNRVSITGNITLGTNALLILDASTVYMESDGALITLASGSVLLLMGGSSLNDPTTDIDDMSAADFAYIIDARAGSTVQVTDSILEGAYGIDAMSATLRFTSSLYRNARGPIVLDGTAILLAVNTSFAGAASPLMNLLSTSSADVRGMGQPTYTVAPGAMFSYSSFAAIEVRDANGKPLGGAEWGFEGSSGVFAGSKGLGGMMAPTMLDHEGFPMHQWVVVPYLTDKGGTKTISSVVARANYAEWTDARIVPTQTGGLLSLTSGNRGLALEDISEHAMLENMGMHDMPMEDMSSMPGMMNMTGPMMTQGPGSSWGDFNGDGHVDVILTAAPETDEMSLMHMNMTPEMYPAPELFLGDGMGMFMPEMMSGLEGATGATGVSAADFDGDGDLDLFVARYGYVGMAMEDMVTMTWDVMPGKGLESKLFGNDGHGNFTDVTAASKFTMPARHTVGGVWSDYNRDGCLDLYAVNMGELIIPMEMEGMGGMGGIEMGMGMSFIRNESNYLFKNNCDGTFIDVTSAAGAPTGGGEPGSEGVFQSLVEDPAMMYWMGNRSMLSPTGSGISYTALWIDFNEDGWPDLLVANDFGVSPLYKNNGDGTFTLWTVQAGLLKLGSAMGLAAADFNRDGHLDIFQSNFNEDFLWMSGGDGTFTDRALEWGVADMSVGWGVASPDLNNDAYPDLAIATGYMSMMMKASERSVLYLNDGGQRMWDVSAGSGFDDPAQGISLAVSDINRDGRPDLFLANTNASNRLFLNREPGGNFVHLDLRGLVSNSYGIGAEVTALIGGKPFKAVVQPGGEYASSSEPGLNIGLGSAKLAQRVTIMWPSGIVQGLGDIPAGTWKIVKEPADSVVDAGLDGTTNTSTEVMLTGTLRGTALVQPSYQWIFHGPTGDTTLAGKDVMFSPVAPGTYSAELVVFDRFGAIYGSDFCIMRVTDTTAPRVDVQMPAKVTTAAAAVFNGSNITDNDPGFKAGGKVEWTFKNGANTVTATGLTPSVRLAHPGKWNVSVKATDLSGNVALRSYEFQATGTAPPPLTFDMVAWAITAVALTILGLAVLSTRVFRGRGAEVPVTDIAEIQPNEIRGPHIDAALETDHDSDTTEEE